MGIGLALSGGAARGIAHIGVLKYLEERGVELSWLAGTSAGSIVAGFYCAGVPLDNIEAIAASLAWKDVAKIAIPRMGLVDSSLLQKFVESHIGEVTFEQLKKPLLINAVDLISGEEVIFESGPVAPAIRASCAIPGIFTPVKHGNMLLVDGGVLNNIPVKPLKEKGLDLVIAVDLNAQKPMSEEPRNIFEVLFQSFHIIQRHRDLLCHPYADVLIKPDLGDISVWDIGKAQEFVRRGYAAARTALDGVNLKSKRRPFWRRLIRGQA